MLTFILKKEWFEIDRKKLKEKLQNLPKKKLKKLLAFAETGEIEVQNDNSININ